MIPSDRNVKRAFAATLRRTPIEWDCAKGLHYPRFLLHTWACSQCGTPLDERARRVVGGDDAVGYVFGASLETTTRD